MKNDNPTPTLSPFNPLQLVPEFAKLADRLGVSPGALMVAVMEEAITHAAENTAYGQAIQNAARKIEARLPGITLSPTLPDGSSLESVMCLARSSLVRLLWFAESFTRAFDHEEKPAFMVCSSISQEEAGSALSYVARQIVTEAADDFEALWKALEMAVYGKASKNSN